MGITDQLYTIKITASEETNGVFILATAIVDENSGRSESQEIVASSSSSILNITPRATYKDFANKIQNVVYTGKQLKNISKNLQDQFRKTFSNEGFLEELFHYIDIQDFSKMSYLFEQIFVKAAGSGSYSIQIGTDKIQRQDLDKTTLPATGEEPVAEVATDGGQAAPGAETNTPVVSDIPPGARVVKFKFLLSPVSGTPVTELGPGSPIVVRLTQGDNATNDAIMSLNLRGEDGVIKPLPCTIHKITHKGNQSDVIIKINDNLYGKYTEEENSVKVRTALVEFKPRDGKPNQNVDKNLEALKNDNSLFFYILAIAALITVAIFVIVFFA